MHIRRPPLDVKMLVFGFARTEQFTVAAGSTAGLPPREIDLLNLRAGGIPKLARAIGHAVSLGFRLGSGEALMLGIPVEEPEHASGRRGLCVVFVIIISRRRAASPAMLVQMLASLELAVAEACSGCYTKIG